MKITSDITEFLKRKWCLAVLFPILVIRMSAVFSVPYTEVWREKNSRDEFFALWELSRLNISEIMLKLSDNYKHLVHRY